MAIAMAKRTVVVGCLVAALVAAAATTSAAARPALLPTCNAASSAVTACASELLQKAKKERPAGDKMFSTKCCDNFAREMQCVCEVRKAFKKMAFGLDLQGIFCFDGYGCDAN